MSRSRSQSPPTSLPNRRGTPKVLDEAEDQGQGDGDYEEMGPVAGAAVRCHHGALAGAGHLRARQPLAGVPAAVITGRQ